MTDKKKVYKIVSTLILAAIIIAIMILIPQSLGLGKGGFENELAFRQYVFYVQTGIGLLVGILILFVIEYLILNKDKEYGSSILFNSQGEFPSVGLFSRFSYIQLILLSIIFFFILGFLSFLSTQQTFFGLAETGIGSLPQQFTPVDNFVYTLSLVPVSENIGLAFVLALGIVLFRYFARKYNMQKINFRIFCFFGGTLLAGLYGVINHLLRYSTSDISIVKVFSFWAICGFLTVVTGTFIVAWIMHIVNNAFVDIKHLFSNDIIIIVSIVILLILIILYLWIYGLKLQPKQEVMKVNPNLV